MKLKAAIYDPYLDTLGGGERYCLSVAEILLKNGYDVDLFWSGQKDLVKKAEERFSLKLDGINLVPDIFRLRPHKIEQIEKQEDIIKFAFYPQYATDLISKLKLFINKLKITKQYDLIFFLSDGSIPFLLSRKNILHVQVPFVFRNNYLKNVFNYIKFIFLNDIVCNSKFTSSYLPKLFSRKTTIIYPPVDTKKFLSSASKKNIILTVGRFDNVLNAKKQDILIKSFIKLIKRYKINNWKFVLAGGSLENPTNNTYLNYLKKISTNYPIEFLINPKFDELKDLYSSSKIYWHAAGYKVNEKINPEKTEHFGITIVEAMASGLVPVVINKGGIPEIISDNKNGFLWNSIEELILRTNYLMSNPQYLSDMSKNAMQYCKIYSKENFEKQLLKNIK